MADGIKLNADFTGLIAALDRLKGPARVSLARSMAVAGGEVLRDEAKALAPRSDGTRPRSGGHTPLADAIYLAFNEGRSSDTMVQYAISWNAKKAPHGHLVEFGHWRYNKIVNGKPQKSLLKGRSRGRGPQDHGGPGALRKPVWVPAHPFLRPALGAVDRARAAMVERGRVRLPEILAGQAAGGTDDSG